MKIAQFVLFTLALSLFRTEGAAADSALDALSRFGSLRSDITYKLRDQTRILEYCPDNTCEAFSVSTKRPASDLLDFAFLYLYGVSGYTYLKDFRASEAQGTARALVAKYETTCSRPTDGERIACILRTLRREAGVELTFIRYDENSRSVVRGDLEQDLKRIGIR